ncbi:MAG TPA: aldehyde dehydrogenase family protein, partial [Candidatus Krumholzibacteria bacterium]|nr:aldehyde dehydrogenase family protein [Candidatus Krumholzibacteria bacterium]
MAKKTKTNATTMTKARIFKELGLSAKMKGASVGGAWFADSNDHLESRSPTTGELLARIEQAGVKDYDLVMKHAKAAFVEWRAVPAPRRGEIVRQVGEALRQKKE